LILPRDIKTKNKIRDAKILQLYLHDKETHENIAVRFGITRTRVSQIIYKNAHLLQFQRNTEKVARINHLKRMLENHPDRMSKKSTLDILEQLRKELEGDKPLVDNSTHHHQTTIIQQIRAALNAEPARTNRLESAIQE